MSVDPLVNELTVQSDVRADDGTHRGSSAPKGGGAVAASSKRVLGVLVYFAPLVVLLAIWQIMATFELYQPMVIQSPQRVFDALVTLFQDGAIAENLPATLQATFIALGLAIVIGVPIGLTLALLPRTERVVEPYLAAFNASPRIAFAPVFLVIFGLSQSAKIALGFSIAIFVMIVNSRAGVENADPDWRALMRASGANRRQIFMKILLPAATPAIFAGVRLAMIYSLLGVVSSELIASTNGMGKLIAQYSSVFQMDRVYALILVMVLIAAFMNNVASLLERRLTRWKSD